MKKPTEIQNAIDTDEKETKTKKVKGLLKKIEKAVNLSKTTLIDIPLGKGNNKVSTEEILAINKVLKEDNWQAKYREEYPQHVSIKDRGTYYGDMLCNLSITPLPK